MVEEERLALLRHHLHVLVVRGRMEEGRAAALEAIVEVDDEGEVGAVIASARVVAVPVRLEFLA
jgi:hypothetical protein